MKLVYQCMAIFCNFSPTLSDFHPLHVENCDSNSWLVVDEDDNGEFRLERVKWPHWPKCHRNSTFKESWIIYVYTTDTLSPAAWC